MRYLKVLLALLVLLGTAQAQSDSTETKEEPAVDTLVFEGEAMLSHAQPVTSAVNFEKRMNQNPTAGLFKSMIVPGWGQLGNKRITKAIVFFGMDAWFIGAAIHYGQQASDFRDLYEAATEVNSRNEYYDLYLDRKDERNKFTWFAVIITFVSMFDAYVDAHLSGYPQKVDDADISFDLRPTAEPGVMASISLGF